jgi:hypothetical protein
MDANGGSSFVTMGTTQLLSVPYALYAKSAGIVSGGTGITIESVSPTGDTLFLSNGQTFVGGGSNGGGGSGNLGLPTITTNAVTDITSNTAHFGGIVSNGNGNEIVETGIVYSTSPNPTIASSKIVCGGGAGYIDTTFARVLHLGYPYDYLSLGNNLHILSSNTTYYVRAYAITENNVAYGNEVSFATLSTGQTGPGGGIVFFDKGENSGGWQYLEAASSDQSNGYVWGCEGNYVDIYSQSFWGLSAGLGEGNTSQIVAGCNDASYAAKLCADLNLGGQNDWFLPSVGELFLMRENLFSNGIGDFIPNASYWSSSEYYPTTTNAWYLNFSYGSAGGYPKSSPLNVRAIRAF